ncbi:antirestriction protein [Brucella endophytica]|uniref:Antirestriction protein n=1 Tax=Brucella endophytica TaxID=1963359 RepID=A0A916WMA6_9HYPH|nr:antirestriction protein [Brucella endophytica]GGB11630.1 antirestriction protein [Brucella endophytica]
MTTQATTPQRATLAPQDRRERFLPTLFGNRLPLLIVAENAVYTFMQQLSPRDYGGGLWNFYEHEGQPLFLAPTSRPRFRIEGEITEYRGEVSAETAGIIATLFTFSHLSFRYESDLLARGYGRLYTYSTGHPEASEIFQAID